MRIHQLLILLLVLAGTTMFAQERPHYSFVENNGQWPSEVIAACDLESGKMFVENDQITYHFFDVSAIRDAHGSGKIFQPEDPRIKGHVYRVRFQGANSYAQPILKETQQTYFNFFLGNNPDHWAGNCQAFGKLVQENLYPNIDLHFYSKDFFLKYDFVVRPDGDPSSIQLQYEGAENLSIENGRLKIKTSINTVWEQQPLAWQIIGGEKHLVACEYALNGSTVTFHFPKNFDRRYELIIDPEIVFSTYSGSSNDNFGYTATYDEDGYLYSGSSAFGQNYPVTTGAYQVTHQGGDSGIEDGIDMALSKYDLTGTFMVWSTFLGGSGDDLPHSIITNSEGELLVYGSTGSPDYPTTAGAIDNSFSGGSLVAPSGTGANFPNGSDIVVTHFNANCTDLLGSTYIGGTGNDGVCTSTALKHNYADEFRGEISLDDDENILIVSSTFSTDFPTVNAVQSTPGGSQDGVLLKLNPNLSNILWSSYIGGSGNDSGFSVTNNSSGDLYICGGTTSTDMEMPANGVQPANAGGIADGYILKISADGQTIEAGTYWGQIEYDQLYFIEIDDNENVYVFGQTTADSALMIINATYGTSNSGNLISKFNPSLTNVIWSTVIGTGNGRPNLSPSAFLVDYCNRIYISGWGITTIAGNPLNPSQNLYSMNDMETTSDAYDNTCTTGDFYMAVFDDNMTQLEYATFFGGGTSSEHVDGGTSRFDRKGVIYQSVCAGCGGNSDFPIYPDNAWSPLNNSSCNNGVYKFDFQLPLTVADFDLTPPRCVNVPIQFTNTSTYALTYEWHFGDLGTSNVPNPTHVYTSPGDYTIMLVVTHNATCNGSDTLYTDITILAPITDNLDDILLCGGQTTQIGLDNADESYTYEWSPSDYLSNTTIPDPFFDQGVTTNYTLEVQHDGCTDTYYQTVDVTEISLITPNDTTICDDTEFVLNAIFQPSNASIIWSSNSAFSDMLNDNTSDSDILVHPVVPATYYVQVERNNCVETASVNVNLVSFQTELEAPFTACMNDTVEVSVISPGDGFQYSWEPSELVLSGQNTPQIQAIITENTVFTVTADTPFGCQATDDIEVAVSLLNIDGIAAFAQPEVIAQGQSSQLSAIPAGFEYVWTPSAGLNNSQIATPIASPEVTTIYTVTAYDGDCTSNAQVKVTVVDFICGPPSIYVPNVFTPNGDNNNEKMFVRGANLTKIYFVIYDRWGEKVFETDKQALGWDGKFEGRDVDPDVYVYYLEATCVGGQQYFEEGNITVVR